MATTQHKACYGTMFPDALHHPTDKPVKGKLFHYELHTVGGMYRGDRTFGVDMKEWDDCVACPEFEHCYKLSAAKMELEAAIAAQ